MEAVKRTIRWLLATVLILLSGVIFFNYYSYIFAREVEGVVVDVQRVSTSIATVIGGQNPTDKDLFSFAVAIKDKSGEIVTASSEDRQWAVVQKNQCAVAKYYPYPPWKFDKSGTYFGARLLHLTECK